MTKLTFFIFFILFAGALYIVSFSGCNESPSAPQSENLTFTGDILPIFEAHCNYPGCHNSTDKQSGINLTNWSSIMLNGSDFGAEIVPYNAKWSHIIQHINTDTTLGPVSEPLMPKAKAPYTNGMPLNRNILLKIMSWINNGAKNDNGEVAFSNIYRKAFITNQASDYIAVVNLDNMFLTRYVVVGESENTLSAPHNVAVDNQGKYFYVTLINDGFVEKFDAMTYQKLNRLYIVSAPGHVIITPDGSKGYVTNYNINGAERYIRSFNTADMTIINTISDVTMNATHGGRITTDGNLLITTSELGEYIQIINTHTDAVEQTIPVDNIVPPTGNGTGFFRPIAVSLSTDDRYAFITCDRSNDVRVLDMNTRTIIRIIPTGLYPIQSECSPDNKWLYVANRNSNSVTVIDVNTLTVYKTISNVGAQPHGVAFTADGKYAYITCESVSGTFVHHPAVGSSTPGTTAVINVQNHTKVKNIEMASFPAGISITR